MELPLELRALFDQAIEATNALSTEWIREEREACAASCHRAMRAAGFPPHDPLRTTRGHRVPYVARTVYRASALSPTQRAAAAFLALHPELPIGDYPLPGSPWAIRRWLGLDPPGVLFEEREDGRTLYEALRSFDSYQAPFHAYLQTLPWRDRVQALTDLSLATSDCAVPPVNELHALLPEIDDSLGTWALARAEWLLEHRAAGRPSIPLHVTMAVLPPIYLALMRAGLANAPRFDALLPISQWCSVQETWLIRTHCALVNAISEERREAALMAALDNLMFDTERVFALQHLLPYFPYPVVARYVLDHAHEARAPQRTWNAVRVVAETSPAIMALYETHMAALGPIPTLRAVSLVARPPFDTLTDAQQAQLAALGHPWNRSAEQMLATGYENALEMNLVSLENEGGLVLEAWLNEGDEGSIFRAGTTEQIAWMGQGGIPECEDQAMLAALREALAWSRLGELRNANGPSEGGPWAAYREARDHCEDVVTAASGDETDVPF